MSLVGRVIEDSTASRVLKMAIVEDSALGGALEMANVGNSSLGWALQLALSAGIIANNGGSKRLRSSCYQRQHRSGGGLSSVVGVKYADARSHKLGPMTL